MNEECKVKTVSLSRAIAAEALPIAYRTIYNKLWLARHNGSPSPLPFLVGGGRGQKIRVRVADAVAWLRRSRWPHKADVMATLLDAPESAWGQE